MPFLRFYKLRYIERARLIGSKIERGEIQWGDIIDYLRDQKISFKVLDISSSILAPSTDDFLSMNDFHFNTDVSHVTDSVVSKMRQYLQEYIDDKGLRIAVGHKMIIIEK